MGLKDWIKRQTAKKIRTPENYRIVYSNFGESFINENINVNTRDPFFVMEIYPTEYLQFQIEVCSTCGNCSLYYAYGDEMEFCEEQKIEIKELNNIIKFERPVKYVRIDPVDDICEFKIMHLYVNARPDLENAQMIYASNIDALKDSIKNNNGKKSIIVVGHAMSKTGAPLLLNNIVYTLSEKEYVVYYLCLDVSAKKCDYEGEYYLFKSIHELKEMVALIQKHGVYGAILNTIVTSEYVKVFKELEIPTVLLIHEMRTACKLLDCENEFKKALLEVDKVVFPTKYVVQEYEDILDETLKTKVRIKPQGYYKEIFLDEDCVDRKEKVIVGCGTAYFGKGIDLFVEAANCVVNHHHKTDCKFLWIGDFEEEKYELWIHRMIHKYGLDNNIAFHPFIENSEEYMTLLKKASAFILTSREDSLPSVLMEAMAAKTPVISFRQTGGAEALLDDGKGILVDYLDVNQMASSINEIVDGKQDVEMIEKAYDYVYEELCFEKYVDYILEELR